MKFKYIYIILVGLTSFLSSCREFPEDNLDLRFNYSEPTLEIVEVKNILAKSITLSGKILQSNGAKIDKIGAHWGESEATIKENSLTQDFISNSFEIIIENLEPEKEYHIILFAHNAAGNGYSNAISVTTGTGLGIVQTGSAGEITSSSAICRGNIINPGESSIEEVGFLYSYEETFESYFKTVIGQLSDKSFEVMLKDLQSNTDYYYKAYAKNSYGIFWGEIKRFKTLPKKEYTTIEGPILIRLGSAEVNFAILNLDDSLAVKRAGICWGLNPMPTIDDFSIEIKEIGPGHYSLLIDDLLSNNKYYVRSFIQFEDNSIEYSYQKDFKTPNELTELQKFKGLPRISSANFVMGKRGYIICGDLGNFFSNELWEYNTEVGDWREWRSFPGGVRRSPIAVSDNDIAYILGGVNMENEGMNDFYSYDPEINTWKQLTPAGDNDKFSISDAVAVIHDNVLLVAGGYQNGILSDEIWEYDILENKWTKLDLKLPIPSKHGLFYIKNNRIFYGFATKTNNQTSDLWSIDMDFKSTWNLEYVNPCTKIRNSIYHESLNSIFFINQDGILFQLNLNDSQIVERLILPKEDSGDNTLMVVDNMIYFGPSRYSEKFYRFDPWWKNN